MLNRASGLALILLMESGLSAPLRAADALQWSGFALLRGTAAPDDGPLAMESLSAQLQLGIDWSPSPSFGAHVHVIGRSHEPGTRRGSAGVTEAYVDAWLHPAEDRLRLRAGAFFLPTSRENVDALWESPYTITPSALNSWWGEELRPIGIDAAWTHGSITAGATLFRGNDTFGAIPPVRGWRISDHWILLGEWIAVDPEYFTSVSAETDGRLGWAARTSWNGTSFFLQATHLDNRSDGLTYGHLANWGTRFTMLAGEYNSVDWTVTSELGWGPTFIGPPSDRFTPELVAAYLLVSRRWARSRATVRVEAFGEEGNVEDAVTVAWLWTPRGPWQLGAELTAAGGDRRLILETRYRFAGR